MNPSQSDASDELRSSYLNSLRFLKSFDQNEYNRQVRLLAAAGLPTPTTFGANDGPESIPQGSVEEARRDFAISVLGTGNQSLERSIAAFDAVMRRRKRWQLVSGLIAATSSAFAGGALSFGKETVTLVLVFAAFGSSVATMMADFIGTPSEKIIQARHNATTILGQSTYFLQRIERLHPSDVDFRDDELMQEVDRIVEAANSTNATLSGLGILS